MVKGIKEMGEAGIWAIIEGILIKSNPMFMCRLKAMDMKMEAGEEVGDFLTASKTSTLKQRWIKRLLGPFLSVNSYQVSQILEMIQSC